MILRRAHRAKNGDRRANRREAHEAAGELTGDFANPFGIGGPHGERFVPRPQQQLLVERGRRSVRLAGLSGHRSQAYGRVARERTST